MQRTQGSSDARPRSDWWIGLAVAIAVTALPVAASPSIASTPGHVSVLFGRMQWTTVGKVDGASCVRLPNTVTLAQAHDALAARGLDAVGVVIPSRTPETGFRCFGNYTTHPGWDLLQRWHAEGWEFVSGGSHGAIGSLGYAAQVAESCGSLPVFASHGIDATGMYAYGNNSWDVGAQTDPVSRCFDFGRRYEAFAPNQRSSTGPPWFQKTHSVNGGRCNRPGLPCAGAGVATTQYQVPGRLAAEMSAAPDTWFAVQFYRFVTGRYQGPTWSWDCTAADPAAHFTSQAELYCYGDFLRVMDALQRAVAEEGVIVADPTTVARAWGRVRTPPAAGERRSTSTSVACGEGTCTATVRDTDDGTPSAPAGRVDWSATGGAFGAVRCTLSPAIPVGRCTTSFSPPAGGATVTARYVGSAIHAPSSGSVWRPAQGDTTPPAVTITFPTDGALLVAGSKVVVRATASDAGGIASVRFVISGTIRFTDSVAPYAYAWWVAPKAGLRIVVEALARDRAGNEAVDRIVITTVAAAPG